MIYFTVFQFPLRASSEFHSDENNEKTNVQIQEKYKDFTCLTLINGGVGPKRPTFFKGFSKALQLAENFPISKFNNIIYSK